jgi:alpha-glucosidase (family GH31 glycosyl hydrolase)
MDAQHYDGIIEYFAHNLYGHMEAEKTFRALQELYPDQRPFILTRSSFAGTGRYSAHWSAS